MFTVMQVLNLFTILFTAIRWSKESAMDALVKMFLIILTVLNALYVMKENGIILVPEL